MVLRPTNLSRPGKQIPPEWESPTREEVKPFSSGREKPYSSSIQTEDTIKSFIRTDLLWEEEEQIRAIFYKPNLQTNQRASYSNYSKSGQAFKIKAKRTESRKRILKKNENLREEVKI